MNRFDSKQGMPETRIVASRGPSHGKHPLLWCMGIFAASAVMILNSLLGLLVYGYVTTRLLEGAGRRGLIAAIASTVAVDIAIWLVFGLVAGLSMVLTTGVALAITALMAARSANVTAVSAAIAIFSVAMFAADAWTTSLTGADVGTETVESLMETMRVMLGSGIDAKMTLNAAEGAISVLWPIVYPVNTAMNAAFAAFGVTFTFPRGQMRRPHLERFDAPMWPVGLLALAVLGLGAGLGGLVERDVALPISVTVIMFLRAIFALQGYGVVSWLVRRFKLGCLVHLVIIFFAVWAEMMFFVLSIIGLVDMWANFRHLPRDRARTEDE